MEQQEVIISRPLWLNGEGYEASSLRRESDGKMCCLGFTLKQLANISDEELTGKDTPIDIAQVESRLPNSLKWLLGSSSEGGSFHSASCNDLMICNDVELKCNTYGVDSQEIRERKISQTFAEHNIKITFVD